MREPPYGGVTSRGRVTKLQRNLTEGPLAEERRKSIPTVRCLAVRQIGKLSRDAFPFFSPPRALCPSFLPSAKPGHSHAAHRDFANAQYIEKPNDGSPPLGRAPPTESDHQHHFRLQLRPTATSGTTFCLFQKAIHDGSHFRGRSKRILASSDLVHTSSELRPGLSISDRRT